MFNHLSPSIWYSRYKTVVFHLVYHKIELILKVFFGHNSTVRITNITYPPNIIIPPLSVEDWRSSNNNIDIKPQRFYKNIFEGFWLDTVKIKPILKQLLVKQAFTMYKFCSKFTLKNICDRYR